MSPRRIAVLRYGRRDDQIRVEADITDSELHDLALGLAMCLTESQRRQLIAHMQEPEQLPDLARKICAEIGTPHVIDVGRRRIEEENVE